MLSSKDKYDIILYKLDGPFLNTVKVINKKEKLSKFKNMGRLI